MAKVKRSDYLGKPFSKLRQNFRRGGGEVKAREQLFKKAIKQKKVILAKQIGEDMLIVEELLNKRSKGNEQLKTAYFKALVAVLRCKLNIPAPKVIL